MKARRHEEAIICGVRAVRAAIEDGRAKKVWATRRHQALLRLAAESGVETEFSEAPAIAGISGHDAHQGIAASVKTADSDWRKLSAVEGRLLVAVDGVTDPRNLGAVLRTARAFGAAGVVAPARRNAPLSAAAAKAASGAAGALPLFRPPNLRRALEGLRAAGWFVAGASDGAEAPFHAQSLPPPPRPICWVFGGEEKGMRRLTAESCDILIRLPTVPGEAGCLNVSAACTACLALAAMRENS